jgi:ComF family protein
VREAADRAATPLLHLLFPPVCSLCGCDLGMETTRLPICLPCRSAVTKWEQPACPRCARPLPTTNGAEPLACPACAKRRFRFTQATALGVYAGPLRDAVLRAKRQRQEPLTMVLGELLAEALAAGPGPLEVDVIAPVPMHWLRRLTRGVNGPEILAEAVAARLRLPVDRRLLSCGRRTRKQGTLAVSERQHNVRGAYRVSSRRPPRGRRVLVVDDVMTSGATLNEIARILQRSHATRVSIAVVARGVGFD